MNRRLAVAGIGGLVAVFGSMSIFLGISFVFNIFARSLNPDHSISLLDNVWSSFKLAHLYFLAGFISTWIMTPPAIHRLSSPQYKQTGFVTTGFLLGATAGLLCSWLAAFLFISQLTILGIASGKIEESLHWATKLLGYYTSSAMLLFGSLAATIGALAGSATEWWYRRFRHNHSTVLDNSPSPDP